MQTASGRIIVNGLERCREWLAGASNGSRAWIDGTPSIGPRVMTGHQPGFFHPGIAAKYIAAQSLAEEYRGEYATVVVDHTEMQDPANLRVPVVSHGVIIGESHIPTHSPSAPSDIRSASPETDTPASIAERNARALEITPDRTAHTSSILNSLLGRRFLEMMLHDASMCARAYNAALQDHPSQGVTPLRIDSDQDQCQLPLWIHTPSKPLNQRRTASAKDIRDILDGGSEAQCAPKALTLSAFLRLDVCDVFIHGLGGADYDTLTDHWIRHWHGDHASQAMAPRLIVSGDLLLHGEAGPVSMSLARKARWSAHHAMHTPSDLDDTESQHAKDVLIEQIQRGTNSADRAHAFQDMQALLVNYRLRKKDELEGMRDRADALEQARAYSATERARAWPAILYPQDAWRAYRRSIQTALTPG